MCTNVESLSISLFHFVVSNCFIMQLFSCILSTVDIIYMFINRHFSYKILYQSEYKTERGEPVHQFSSSVIINFSIMFCCICGCIRNIVTQSKKHMFTMISILLFLLYTCVEYFRIPCPMMMCISASLGKSGICLILLRRISTKMWCWRPTRTSLLLVRINFPSCFKIKNGCFLCMIFCNLNEK